MRGKGIRYWLAAVSAGLALSAVMGSALGTATHASTLTQAQQQLNQVKQQQSQNQQRVQQLTNQEQKIEAQLQQITASVQATSNNIVTMKDEIRTQTQHIKKTAIQVTVTKRRVVNLTALLGSRLQVMYENGTVSYVDVIFSSTSFSDFLNRMTALTLIARQDSQLLQSVKLERVQLSRTLEALSAARRAQLGMYRHLQSEQVLEAQQLASQKAILRDVQQQKAAAIQDLQNERGAEQNLAQQIQQLLKTDPSIGDTSKLHLGTGPWIWPVPHYTDITSPYGWRYIFGSQEFHNGIDIGAPYGTPIVAVADGVVLYAGSAYGFGHWIVLKHANGLLTIYGHMYASGLLVQVGQVVKQGQVIAYVGSDGQSTGPHLHFSVASGFDGSGFPITMPPLNYIHD